MVAETAFERRERKSPLAEAQWSRALESAELVLPIERFDGEHDAVTIRTIYLDTPGLDSYREYLEDSPLRQKVRIRQYGYNGRVNGQCWLELKLRHYGVSVKRRFRSRLGEIMELLDGRDIEAHVREMNSADRTALQTYSAARDAIRQRGLRPILRVDYTRVAFQRPHCAELRLTLDRDVCFQAVGRPAVRFPGIVLEAKYRDDEPGWLMTLMRALAIEDWSRFSKYARAVRDLGLDGHG